MSSKSSKRKAATSTSSPPASKKRTSASQAGNSQSSHTTPIDVPDSDPTSTAALITETLNIVNRSHYPAQISTDRIKQYTSGTLQPPLQTLEQTVANTSAERDAIATGEAVVHWFKRDLRLQDNRALSLACEKARSSSVPLICLFVISPQDYDAHATSAIRVDFELRSLAVLREDLAALDIPLLVTTVDERDKIPARIMSFCDEWGAKHIFCNVEYEVDELRRETKLTRRCLSVGISFNPVHDDAIVAPGRLKTGTGRQYAVFTPWHRAWVAHIHAYPHLLEEFPAPTANPSSARKSHAALFNTSIPSAPPAKRLPPAWKTRAAALWPAGEHEAHDRLATFLSTRGKTYSETRNFPAKHSTSLLSVHLAAGTLAARSAVRAARAANSSMKLDGGAVGFTTWIAELGWREFYKHVLAAWPHVCMHAPFKPEFADLQWDDDPEHRRLTAWCEGRTGFPIVDAAMRQLRATGWMHNRLRMVVASFLAKDLLIDWRLGERWFMLNLVDGDFASNSGGWGWSVSCGVDSQPYFRIFNPTLQSERFDDRGEFIRTWVPELNNVQGRAIHDPYGRGAGQEAKRKGYPEPIVDHKESREKAMERYKTAATNKS